MQSSDYACRVGLLAIFVIASVALCAQQATPIPSENGTYTLHENTHLVLLDVTVKDFWGHPVAGLTKDDFKLMEDGQPQTIEFFEEHAPVDPAEIAKERAAATAGQPPNTFSNYEPFTGRPVTVLLLNELFPVMMNVDDLLKHLQQQNNGVGMTSLYHRMLDTVQNAPPDTPFAVYLLDSELRLVQPMTTDRALIQARIDEIFKDPHFGSEKLINPNGYAAGLRKYQETRVEDIPLRRQITSKAMQQLVSDLKAEPGRKNLIVFTGPFQCSVVGSRACPNTAFPNDTKDYLCGLMDTLEQGRMSIYRYYPDSEIGYGFGCPSSVDLGTSANYYTLYYSPTNAAWDGKYRATKVEVPSKKGLQLVYRKGYYGTPENVAAHYYTANEPSSAAAAPNPSGPAIAATVVATGTADLGEAGAVKTAPTPVAAVFSVQVVPAPATAIDKEGQEYRQLTLHFSMPASEFKVAPSDGGQYAARLEIAALGYSDGKRASLNGSQGEQVTVNFNGAADPRIAKSTIAATLTLDIPEHGRSRWLEVGVRDMATGQLGTMVVPMEQVKLPEAR